MKFEDLAKEVQDYINKRASSYNRTGEELFNQKQLINAYKILFLEETCTAQQTAQVR